MSLEALSMGGYGLYVWGSFGAALLIHLWIALAPRLRRRALLDSLRDAADEE